MAISYPKLKWCLVRFGEDMNWWVYELSDDIHWDLDGLAILDPKQTSYIIDLLDPLRDYGFLPDVFESAFLGFSIDKDLGKGRVRLKRYNDPLLQSEDLLFGLPDIMDEEKGPYADFLTHITKLRVKMLNDLISFEQDLTIEELEDDVREKQNNDFMEGRATHVFEEMTSILEYIPDGYELDEDEEDIDRIRQNKDEIEEEFPDVEEEKIEEDETMKWDEEEEEEEEEEEAEAEEGNFDDEEEEDEEDEGYKEEEK